MNMKSFAYDVLISENCDIYGAIDNKKVNINKYF